MDGRCGHEEEGYKKDNNKSGLKIKTTKQQDVINFISLGDEQPTLHVLPMFEDFEEDESVGTKLKKRLSEVDDGALSESMLEPIVVTEDGLVFPAEQSNIMLGNDRTICLIKDDTVYEIEKILDINTLSELVSTPAAHQFITRVRHESTNKEESHINACKNEIGSSNYQPCYHQTCSEDQSTSTKAYSTAVVNRLKQQSSQQASGSVRSLPQGSQQHTLHIAPDHKHRHQCKVCGKSFDRPSALAAHNRTHTGEKPYRCKVCSRSFSDRSNLVHHHLVHTGEKPHRCDTCGKCFAQASNLTKHERTHTQERPYRCNICSRSFSDRSNLTKHNLIHTGEKPHECTICGKCFSQAGSLTTHKWTHTNEKPYQCKVCGKCFSVASHLSSHNLIHTGEKPCQCQTCSKSFRTSSQLSGHRLTHNTKAHQCQQCGKSFRHKRNLSRHSKVHSNNNPAYE